MWTSLNQLLPPINTGLRVFCFPRATGWVCIDFKMLPVMPGWLYVVPAGHCIWGAAEFLKDCFWVEVNEDLPSEAQQGLGKLLFAPQKQVFLPMEVSSSLEVDTIIGALSKEVLAAPAIPQSFAQKRATLQFYHELAEAFCRQIKQWSGGEKQKSVPKIATSLNQQERTLRRACVATYGVPPVEMLLYQKALLGARLLVETELKLGNIADHLGFADESQCTRFLKEKMGMCPMDFRRRVLGWRD